MFETITKKLGEYKWNRRLEQRRRLYIRKDSRGIMTETEGLKAAKPHDPSLIWKVYLAVSWVRACVDVITRSALSEGIDIRGDKENAKKIAKLIEKPNPQDSGEAILQNISEDLLIFGNGFVELVDNRKGELAEMYNLDPVITDIKVDDHGTILGYEQESGGSTAVFEPDEVAHFPMSTKGAGVWGLSPLDSLILTVEADVLAQHYNKNFFVNAARPRGAFWLKNASDTTVERTREYFKSEFEGSANAHKDMFLAGEIEHKDLQKSPQDIEFLGLRRFNREEILAVYRVPPSKIAIIETGNIGAGTGEHQERTFQKDTVRPHQRKMADRFNRTIVQGKMGIHDAWLTFKSTDLDGDKLKAEIDERKAKTYAVYIEHGVLKPEEVRSILAQELPLPVRPAIEKQEIPEVPDTAIPIKERMRNDWLDKDPNLIRTKDAILKEIERQRKRTAGMTRNLAEGRVTIDDVVESFDAEELRDVLNKNVEKTFTQGFVEAAKELKKQIETEFGPRPGDYDDIAASITVLIDDFSEGLRESIRAGLAEGIQAGEGAGPLAGRVSAAYSMPRTFMTTAGPRTLSNEVWATLTARSETIGALNESRRLSLERQGVEQFDVIIVEDAEQECRKIAAAGPYSADEAKGLLPVHPNCRCRLIPRRPE